MPTYRVPIINKVQKNTEESSVRDALTDLTDCYVNEDLAVVKRPCLLEWKDLSTSACVDGIFYWQEQDLVISISNQTVYKTNTLLTTTNIGTISGSVGGRVSFTNTKLGGAHVLAFSHGSSIYYTDGNSVTEITDAEAPTNSTHVAFLDGYLISNDDSGVNSGTFFWSDINSPDTWSAASFQDANGSADDIVSVNKGWRELLVVGQKSNEVYYDDGVTPWVRYPGSEAQRGCSAGHTVTFVDNTWYWLDNTHRFIRLEGRIPKIISTPFDKEIASFAEVTDAYSDSIHFEGQQFYVTHFPTADRTFAYNIRMDYWMEWGEWDSTDGSYKRWRGNNFTYHETLNKQLVGDKTNGKIYEMSSDVYQDNATTCRSYFKTAKMDLGTQNRKRFKRFKSRIRRSDKTNIGDIIYRYRTDRSDVWSNIVILTDRMDEEPGSRWVQGTLGFSGRMVQLEFYHSDSSPFQMQDILIEYDEMPN